MKQELNKTIKIKVIGVGGGGCNAVNRMYNPAIEAIEFIVANTDGQVLLTSHVPKKIVLGEETYRGLGAGANPEIGRASALESEQEIKNALADADLIFIAAGMGGGTGTGASPVIARIAQETGALVIAIVTKPFLFEGRKRINEAEIGLAELKANVDSIITISNDRLLKMIGSLPITDSFKEADAVLKQGVQTITDLITTPAMINLDFADVRTVMAKKGDATFGIGIAKGENKAREATRFAIDSPLIEGTIKGAKDLIVNVVGGNQVTLNEAYEAIEIVREATQNLETNILLGLSIKDELEPDEMIVTLIATGVDQKGQTVSFNINKVTSDNIEITYDDTRDLTTIDDEILSFIK